MRTPCKLRRVGGHRLGYAGKGVGCGGEARGPQRGAGAEVKADRGARGKSGRVRTRRGRGCGEREGGRLGAGMTAPGLLLGVSVSLRKAMGRREGKRWLLPERQRGHTVGDNREAGRREAARERPFPRLLQTDPGAPPPAEPLWTELVPAQGVGPE